MKKILALTLSISMALSLAVSSFAAHEGDYDKDKYKNDPDYFKVGDQAYSYEDFIGIKPGATHLVPGNEYFYELTWENRPFIEEFFDHYTTSVNVGTAFPGYDSDERKDEENYLSSVSAQKLVKADLQKNNGKYYLHLDVSESYPYTTEKTLWVYIIAKDKLDETYRSRATLELDIGYEKNKTPVYVNSSECTVDNSEPIMEFSEDVGNCTVEMEDGSFFEARFSTKKDTKVNFHHSMEGNLPVQMSNSRADMRFLNFTASPDFMYKGRLMLKSPDNMEYAYEILSDGTITPVGTKPYEGYISVITDKLGSYVVSDIPLNSPKAGTVVKPSEPAVTPSQPAPSEPGKLPFNPGTGAAI